jgi:hypothetical protein
VCACVRNRKLVGRWATEERVAEDLNMCKSLGNAWEEESEPG